MQASLAFTPRDTIALWDAFEKAGLPKERIKDLDPKVSHGGLITLEAHGGDDDDDDDDDDGDDA